MNTRIPRILKCFKALWLSTVFLLPLSSKKVFSVQLPSDKFRKTGIHAQAKTIDEKFTIPFLEGNVLLREDNGSMEKPGPEHELSGKHAAFFCRKDSKLILALGKARFHFLGENTFSCSNAGIVLRTGALLADWRRDGALHLEVFDAKLRISDKSIFFAQVTANGGLKLIVLAGKATIENISANGEEVSLFPGELIFAKPLGRGFSDKLNVDLKTLVATSALIHEFPDSNAFRRNLAKAALEQHSLIRKRYRAVVGDARTPETFDIRELPSESEANKTKPTD